jgi:hypothetical protein
MELATKIVENAMKPVMGRRASLRDVERIVTQISPIVEEAARQPEVESSLKLYAQDSGLTLDEARARWVGLEEADLLLEAGGNDELVSVANAVGVAQWIAETGQRAGLKVNLPDSQRLTAKIDPLKSRVAWLDYLARPESDPNAPGAPPVTPQEAARQLPPLRQKLEVLRAKRRAIDERYDVRKALFTHARYLLNLYPRFPSMDWLFQAYHGGEAGAPRLLKKFLGARWPGSTAVAIRRGHDGKPLRFEDVYFGARPKARPEAFLYLYGRGDDHRHYWWKLKAAQEAIALYRRNAAEFRRRWESFLPGRAKEALWYLDAPARAFAADAEIQSAVQKAQLVTIAPAAAYAAAPGASAPHALRSEAAGLLRLIATAFRKVGGTERLRLGNLTVSPQTLARQRAAQPPAPKPPLPPDPLLPRLPGGGLEPDFDFHTTGLAFDILRPSDDKQRKLLEYAIGYLQDRQILWHMEEKESGPRRYHVVPSPVLSQALATLATSGKMPGLPGI